MPPNTQQLALAATEQQSAARDARPQVRLIAGPGSGKSFAVEDRVLWLLQFGTDPSTIFVTSFTNAAADDLRARVRANCARAGVDGSQVRVTTLHSVALRVLRASNLLGRFPAPPRVLDNWELDEILTAEVMFSLGASKTRADNIRRDRDAFWSTGNFDPPNYIPPNPAITDSERTALTAFLNRFEQTYSCILSGAIVRECVEQISAGLANPVAALGLKQLIVDEYQDLNPVDQEFIASCTSNGAVTMVAGDDDQSIYSFRFAMPRGIQDFVKTYPSAGDHALTQCFRCASDILAAANTLIANNPPQNRIAKISVPVYAASSPPVAGTVLRWRFTTGAAEAAAIAESCESLIKGGVEPGQILVLLSDRHILQSQIQKAFAARQIELDTRAGPRHLEEGWGRALFALGRILCNENDYIAYRSLLALLPGVGIGTCLSIRDTVVASGLNYRDVFRSTPPGPDPFKPRDRKAIAAVAGVLTSINGFSKEDSLAGRRAPIVACTAVFGNDVQAAIAAFLEQLPDFMTLVQVVEYMGIASAEAAAKMLADLYLVAGQPSPAALVLAPAVKLMTMHGAKGLSAKAVFIPGLEEQTLPGGRRAAYPGLVEEAARLLYVSITRARALCVLSFANRRTINGESKPMAPSRFDRSTGGAFAVQSGGMTPALVQAVIKDCGSL